MRKRVVTREELAAPLVSYEDAVPAVLASCAPLAPAGVSVGDALGLVCAEQVRAPLDVPGFDNSAMDGYAVRSADVAAASAAAPVVLRITGDAPAGAEPSPPVQPGTCVKIMTGGPVPPGADAVVPWEDTDARGDAEVAVLAPFTAGRHVRPAGEDVRKGEIVVRAGALLRPVHLGVLASIGLTRVSAHPRPRAAVLSTGEELIAAGEGTPRAGQIYESNGAMLAAMCEAAGARVTATGMVGDDPDAVASWIDRAAKDADLIVTSGGASVGEHDWMREVLSREGELSMWRVAIKPGKPIAFGRVAGVPVFALPGNPGSAFVGAHVFVQRALRVMAGRDPSPRSLRAALGGDVKGSPSRTMFCRVTLRDGKAMPLPAQSSVVLSNLIPTEGFAIVPPGGLAAGSEVTVELID